MAEVLAGEHYNPAVRNFAWEQDGIQPLPTAEAQKAQLEALGFADIRQIDWTHLAIRCFSHMEAASLRHATLLIRDKGEARYRRWVEHARAYRRYFERRELIYVRYAARAPMGN